MRKGDIIRTWIAGVAVLLLLTTESYAQRTRDKILADVKITEDPGCAVIEVGFNFPVRYVRHFPRQTGDELRIQLKAISISAIDSQALSKRESVRPRFNEFAGLNQIIYEGDIEGGPYLTLRFNFPVTFEVGQGANFRSLVVAVAGPEPSPSCSPFR